MAAGCVNLHSFLMRGQKTLDPSSNVRLLRPLSLEEPSMANLNMAQFSRLTGVGTYQRMQPPKVLHLKTSMIKPT